MVTNEAAHIAIIGAGPAGLKAAELLSCNGVAVTVFDAMPSVARKFLMAGKSGLNLTHSEAPDRFLARFGENADWMATRLAAFGQADVIAWAEDLDQELFTGSSGRVFPKVFKASPLLRAWLKRLDANGVHFQLRHSWQGWNPDGDLLFQIQTGTQSVKADAVLLALGGASWPRLGSTGAWMPLLAAKNVAMAPFLPSNCGFDVAWSAHLRNDFGGAPLKTVRLSCGQHSVLGDCVISGHGLEGSAIYTLSAPLRDQILQNGQALLHVDLSPHRNETRLLADLTKPRGKKSFSTHVRRVTGLDKTKMALLHEFTTPDERQDASRLAAAIKALPIPLLATRPIEEAISTAGGVQLGALNDDMMLLNLPGTFLAGEMLDWDAPTGGYLLTACLSQGHAAGQGILRWLSARDV